MKILKVGIFDSGVGGLTVAKAISRFIPEISLIYFGDSARVPYGNKSKGNILTYSQESVDFLINQGADIIVIACNTSSAIALKRLRRQFKVPIIGVIDPGVMATLASVEKLNSQKKKDEKFSHIQHNSKSKRKRKIGITVAATFRTMDSQIYKKKILRCYPSLSVFEVACPLLVPIIEEGMNDQKILHLILNKYLSAVTFKSEILVLGCTHYPLIKKNFKKVFPHLHIVDSAEATAFFLKEIIYKRYIPLQKNLDIQSLPITKLEFPTILFEKKLRKHSSNIKIFTNDPNETFTMISQKLFPQVKILQTTFR